MSPRHEATKSSLHAYHAKRARVHVIIDALGALMIIVALGLSYLLLAITF